MQHDIVDLARTAGFNLSETETKLLRALAEEGTFNGLDFRKNVEGVDASEDLRHWLPSVWGADGLQDELIDIDPWLDYERLYHAHERLYAEAPFPTVSGALLGWLTTAKPVKHLRGIYLSNIKVAGDLRCEVNFNILFTECIFEHACWLAGGKGQLGLTGVYALYLGISGDYPAGIAFNDVQCRGHPGRGGGVLNFTDVKTPSLLIYGMYVPNNVAIRNSAISDVKIVGRIMGGVIQTDRCKFEDVTITSSDASGTSFSASGINIAHDCTLYNQQGVWVSDTVIAGDLRVGELRPSSRSIYSSSRNSTLQLSNVEIKGTLSVDISSSARGIRLVFDHVQPYRYEDRPQDLEAVEQLKAESLEYQELIHWGDNEVNNRIRWLALQPQEPFPLASWGRVAKQLQRRGRFRDARHILIEGERRRREVLYLSRRARFWSWLLRKSTGYGWELWRIGYVAVVLTFIGSAVAWGGMEWGLLVPTTEVSANVVFNPLVYSLDVALPIIDLGHDSLWIPTGRGWEGQLVQIYFWIHIVLGWLIGTLFVIGFTGIAHKTDNG